MKHEPGETAERWLEVENWRQRQKAEAIAEAQARQAAESEALNAYHRTFYLSVPQPAPPQKDFSYEKFLRHGLFWRDFPDD